MIDRFNFIGTEGTTTETGCRPASNTCPDNGGQDAINKANWLVGPVVLMFMDCGAAINHAKLMRCRCDNGNAGQGSTPVQVTYDNAAIDPINVASDKTILGEGTSGVMRGKGLRMANGAKNVIIQNIHITELNPQYIWGGDAITIAGSDLVWIDHVKVGVACLCLSPAGSRRSDKQCQVSLVGRQQLVLGTDASNRVSVSNNEFDGVTKWSASCDGHHYWAIFFDGSSDLVTMKGNYIHHTSGRSPKVTGNTLLHVVRPE